MLKIKNIIPFVILLILLIFTRYVNISWGIPHMFHPDERNIIVSLGQLHCNNIFNLKDCLNPHFFAYGQFFLYLGYLFKSITHITSFFDMALILRFLSATFSVFTTLIGFLIIKKLTQRYLKKYSKKTIEFGGFFVLIFSPILIQIAHFGTTESILVFLYTSIIYTSLLFLDKKVSSFKWLVISSVLIGIAIATKISSLIFLFVPLITLYLYKDKSIKQRLPYLLHVLFLTFVFAIIFSPHNLISYRSFLGSLNYESAVALGRVKVFYTNQFEMSVPIFFQIIKVFPYTLGVPVFIFFILGLFFLPKNKEFNFLKLSFLAYFIPSSFLYAKWTRFMAPVFVLMVIIAYIFLLEMLLKKLKKPIFRNIFFWVFIFFMTLPGIIFTSIYFKIDTRAQASNWTIKNVQDNSFILSETANVVDIPFGKRNNKKFNIESFDFYNIDSNDDLYKTLQKNIKEADYIMVPSRRIFANYTCLMQKDPLSFSRGRCAYLEKKYPRINKYYKDLFSGKLGFKKVAEFKLFDDEFAEETFSVFDHPVVRIYKRI
ncbi:MAG: hypothetical protein ABH812_00080 [bacterium]